MPVVALEDLPRTGALLALDPGGRRIGMAACDPGRILVTPVGAVVRDGRFAADAAAIFAAYDSRGCAGMVIGLPLNMDDSEGPRAQSARALARNLLKARDIPIAMHDERLTSAEAEERLRAKGVQGAKIREQVDALAAALILEDALAALARSGGPLRPAGGPPPQAGEE